MSLTLIAALAVAVAAGLMRGFAGVGSGMFMAPIFAVLFGPVATVGIIILMEVVVTAQLMPGTYRDIDWRVVAPMGVMATLFMPVGTWVLVSTDPDLIARATAAVVLISTLVLLAGWRYQGRKPLPATLGVGALSGTLMAATSLGNPPVIVYLLSSQDAAKTNRANFTGYFAVTLSALILWMLARGLIAADAARTALILLPVYMAAAWLGGRLFRQSSEQLYRRIALAMLIAAGLYGLLR